MRRKFSPQIYIIAFAAVLSLASCSKTDIQDDTNSNQQVLSAKSNSGNSTTTYYGPITQMGNGHIRSFGILEKQTDKPIQIGFEITAGALQDLPHGHGVHYLLSLHPKVKASTIFDHMVANWNSHGHEPGPYLAPHFDFHFYMISSATRLGITANDPLSVAPIPSGYLPADYIGPIGPEPEMGGHCVDVTSPELNGSPFTHTFIYGGYNSKVNFYEPMVTLAAFF